MPVGLEAVLRRARTHGARPRRAPTPALRPPSRRRRTPPASRLLLIANGNASRVTEARLDAAQRALRSLGASVETRRTCDVDEFAELWRSTRGRRIVLLGGDGTVHAAANMDPARAVALIPAGGANNVARSLGIPVELATAARLAVEGSPRRIDAVRVTAGERTLLVVEGVSIGLHALARAHYRAVNSADRKAAVRAAAQAVARYGGVRVAIESDERAERAVLGQLFVANMPRYAFGLQVAPAARPDDGLLDVVAIDATRASLVPLLVSLRHGTHVGREDVRTWQARRVRLTVDGSPVVADTTILDSCAVELSVERGALSVVAP